jgi:hypothetical protein
MYIGSGGLRRCVISTSESDCPSQGVACQFALAGLLSARDGVVGSERSVVVADVPAVPVGGDSGDGVEPSLLSVVVVGTLAELAQPGRVAGDSLLGESPCSALQGMVAFFEGSGEIRIGHSEGSGNEPADQVGGASSAAPACVYEAFDPFV